MKLIKTAKWSLAVALALTILSVGQDAAHFNPAQRQAVPHLYDLVSWEASHFMRKWLHLAVLSLPWNSRSEEEKRMQVERYFELVDEVARLQRELDRTDAGSGGSERNLAMGLEHRLDDLQAEQDRLLDDVEETIEAAISMAASTEGLGLWGGLLFPPVDIRLTGTPRLLVTSPRDRIERTHDVLVSSDIRLSQRERIEEALLRESDLSALVLDIGGLATYPAALPGNRPLLPTLRISAHEWLHHYFFFRPLGQHLFDNAEMQILNETAADIAGRELGDRAFELLGFELPAPDGSSSRPTSAGAEPFDFRREMSETRRRVDELLADGKVEEAEAYMNERRDVFADNMIFIRKLNQAYFAFHGTYAGSAASVSPIGGQLRRFRDLMPSVGAFIMSISDLSSYEQFLRRLQELEADAASRSGRHPGTEAGLKPILAEGVFPQGGFGARPRRQICGRMSAGRSQKPILSISRCRHEHTLSPLHAG